MSASESQKAAPIFRVGSGRQYIECNVKSALMRNLQRSRPRPDADHSPRPSSAFTNRVDAACTAASSIAVEGVQKTRISKCLLNSSVQKIARQSTSDVSTIGSSMGVSCDGTLSHACRTATTCRVDMIRSGPRAHLRANSTVRNFVDRMQEIGLKLDALPPQRPRSRSMADVKC